MANYIKSTAIQENSISETKLDSSLQSWKETVTNHINNNDNPHNITKSSIGLDNVTNDAQVKRSELGVANGVATLDSTGKVPSGQLPSYVDDVIEGYLYNGVFYKDTSYTTSIVGESGKIYIDLPTNKTYRWTGSVYGVISETIALGETSSTAYRGDRGKIAYDHSQSAHAPSNAQANVIETIKVNGTALTPNSKAVDITIPTVGNGTITIKQGDTSKGTFTTNQNGNTTIELTDTNTTYTAGDGLSLSGTTFSNNGVRSIATGTTNGTISVNTNGNISNIEVYGLKSAAYTNSSDYAAASHTHSYLPLSGGAMAGDIATKSFKSGTDSLGLYIEAKSNVGARIQYNKSTTGMDYDTLLLKNGDISWNNNPVLHSGNYNSYSPKLDGTGASGTWGISISGNAATATNADTLGGYSASAVLTANNSNIVDLNEISVPSIYRLSAGNPNLPSSIFNYSNLLTVKYPSSDTAWQLIGAYSSDALWFRRGSWKEDGTGTLRTNAWKEIAFTDSNVASASKLQNSRTIWGQSFDGTGNVSGALTGVTTITTSGQICINTSSSQRNNYNEGIRCNLGGSDNWASVVLGGASGSTDGAGSGVYSLLVNSSLFRIRQNNTEVLCINTSNNVGIGTTSPSYKLDVNGTIGCTSVTQLSDIKYKKNIKQIEYKDAINVIESLNPVTWDWNENTEISGSSSGFIAQEVKDIIPNAVSEGDENTLSLDYIQLHSYEIKVIQEQQKEIKDLKQRLEVLENLVLQLTNREI